VSGLPGPALDPLPLSFAASPVEALVQARLERGDIFAARWLGVPTVFFTGPGGRASFFRAEREHMTVHNTETVKDLFGQAVFNLSGPAHARARSLLRPALSSPALEPHAARAVQLARKHAARWAAAPQVEALQAARLLTWDACAELILGLPPGSGETAKALLGSFTRGANVPPVGRQFRPGYWRGLQARSRLRQAILAAARTETPTAPPSVLGQLAATARQRGDDPSALPDHVLAILIAAWETTASLITWILAELAALPADGALTGEAAAIVADPAAVLDRARIPGLRSVLLETERLHSPNPLSRRTVTTPFDAGGLRVPAGWRAAYSPAADHLMPDLYPGPLDFRPSRFRGDPDQAGSGLLAFGAGLHACPGRPFAEMIALSATAAVLCQHRVLLPAGAPGRIRYWPVKVPAAPLPVSLRPA
jgi:cytochrome P450